MKRRNERILPIGQYPTDEKGIPLKPYEVNFNFVEGDEDSFLPKNNHHHNYYAKTFGALAISQTFRDLESQQTTMVVWRHRLLHQLYQGIPLPEPKAMMEVIEEDYSAQNGLKIYNCNTKQYEYKDITDDTWEALKQEYNTLAVAQVFVDLRKRP
jgi:hypothetical protein